MKEVKKALTLVEILIILAIIGIIAGITLPTLIADVDKKVKENKIRVFEKKFSQGTDLMHVNGEIGPYYGSTEDFVNVLAKHLKIIKICNGLDTKLSECSSYNKIFSSNNEEFNIDNLTNGSKIGLLARTKIMDYSSHNVGIVLADGTTAILAFNTKCPAADPDSRDDNSSACISGIYDLNGKKGPNKFGKDIVGFNGASIGCGAKVGNYCLSTPKLAEPLSVLECRELQSDLNIPNCTIDNDYWAGAYAACGGKSNMLTSNDATQLINNITGVDTTGIYVGYHYTWNIDTADNLKNKTFWMQGYYELTNTHNGGRLTLQGPTGNSKDFNFHHTRDTLAKTRTGFYTLCIIEKKNN